MFPLVDTAEPNPTELFQIWLNLPAADKMVEPYFTMLWADDIPVVEFDGGSVTVVAGASAMPSRRRRRPTRGRLATTPR